MPFGGITLSARHAAVVGLSIGLLAAVPHAHAAECPGHPDALGTSRVIEIDPAAVPMIGTMQYPSSLPLADKEVVLTFDDGPLPPKTTHVLDVLASECIKANYFIVGSMAKAYPDVLRRIQKEGHVIGTHSQSHPHYFDHQSVAQMEYQIDQGIESVAEVLGDRNAVAPFFRIPGLRGTTEIERIIFSRGLNIWSADLPVDDWKHISPNEIVHRAMRRLDAKGKGVILLHDIQKSTAAAMPELIRRLKAGGYRIVQVVPKGAGEPMAMRPTLHAHALAPDETSSAARAQSPVEPGRP